MAEAAFSPLTDAERHAASATSQDTGVEWQPIQPVPDGVDLTVPHHRLGSPSAIWRYVDANGRLLFAVARFDKGNGGKEFLPFSFCDDGDGERAWRWKGIPAPRPLYGLDQLGTSSGAPVLVVEGEKAADAARLLFPDHICVTSPNGSGSAAHADWSVLQGRQVVIWPDADQPGVRYSMDVTKQLMTAGALSVAVVDLPAAFAAAKLGWDLADALPDGLAISDVVALVEGAKTVEPIAKVQMPSCYVMRSDGLYYENPAHDDKPSMRLCGPFEVIAETRNADGRDWGRWLHWKDHDGRSHDWAMPCSALAADSSDVRRHLLEGGMDIHSGRSQRDRLTEFLTRVRTDARARAVARVGWHDRTFVLPDTTFGEGQSERVVFQSINASDHAFAQRGELQGWQNAIGQYAEGNSRLVLAISAAFASPLLNCCNEQSGGLHFRGTSQTGKTTALRVAGSVWGGGGVNGFIKSWRATDNGLESVAEAHCDALLCLDELGQIHPAAVGEAAYMLANGAGKSRANRTGGGRQPAQWRVLFLSTGEISLADKMAEGGKQARAGQEVRLVDIPADAGVGLGLFEDLHGFASADALARHFKDATEQYFGEPIRAYLRQLVTVDPDDLASTIREARERFFDAFVPADAAGQVKSVASRFALIAAAGTLATVWEIVPWHDDAAHNAAGQCFNDWLNSRGTVGASEVAQGLAAVRSFIEEHGASRFGTIGAGADQSGNGRILHRAGFRECIDGHWEYLIFIGAWKSEVCRGLDATLIAKEMAQRQMLKHDKGRQTHTRRVPGQEPGRYYHVLPALFAEGS